MIYPTWLWMVANTTVQFFDIPGASTNWLDRPYNKCKWTPFFNKHTFYRNWLSGVSYLWYVSNVHWLIGTVYVGRVLSLPPICSYSQYPYLTYVNCFSSCFCQLTPAWRLCSLAFGAVQIHIAPDLLIVHCLWLTLVFLQFSLISSLLFVCTTLYPRPAKNLSKTWSAFTVMSLEW